jgi:hypothetical protein
MIFLHEKYLLVKNKTKIREQVSKFMYLRYLSSDVGIKSQTCSQTNGSV